MKLLVLMLFMCFATVDSFAGSVVATWYGKVLAHHKTASGETFDPDALTAASWHYPFGTLLKLTNVKNRKSVVVRINDRGPNNAPGRDLDVSERAADLLGFKRDGIARLEVEVVK